MPIKSSTAAITKPLPPTKALEDIEDQDLSALFGFSDFNTSKGANHQGDAQEAVFKEFIAKREHRQFMNKKASVRNQQ